MLEYIPPLTEEQKPHESYKWNPNYPGSLKPGGEDCFPLDEVMNSGVLENMIFDERDIDERPSEIFEVEEDLLEWLAKENRLLPSGSVEDEWEMEAEQASSGVTMEDLQFGDQEDRTLAYYLQHGEGTAIGESSDFGGVSDSSSELADL